MPTPFVAMSYQSNERVSVVPLQQIERDAEQQQARRR